MCRTYEEDLVVHIDRPYHHSESGDIVNRPEVKMSISFGVGDTKDITLSVVEAESMATALLSIVAEIKSEYQEVIP